MKGNAEILATLNALLQGEMTAVDQYFIHSRMYKDQGLHKLFERLKHETEEEFEHATALIRRILFLEGVPDLGKRDPLNIGHDAPSMLRSDLAYEYKVVADLKAAIALCEQHQDYGTRELLEKLLEDTEEDHAYWLEQQLGLIDKMGLENYLQAQATPL